MLKKDAHFVPALAQKTKQSSQSMSSLPRPSRRKTFLVKSSHPPSPPTLDSALVLDSCKLHFKLMTLVESKDVVPRYEGKDAPSRLQGPSLGFAALPNPLSTSNLSLMTKLFSSRQYRFRLAQVLNMSSSATGAVNSVVAITSFTSNTDFVALSSVFSEFFVNRMVVTWQPVSLANGPTGFTNTTMVATLPLGVACLQHQTSAYTSISDMAQNYQYQHANTGMKFTESWINVESRDSTVAVEATGPVQSWAQFGRIADYTGSIQFLSQPAPPALPVTQVLGAFLVELDLSVRLRV